MHSDFEFEHLNGSDYLGGTDGRIIPKMGRVKVKMSLCLTKHHA
jgi:hypothetical protein